MRVLSPTVQSFSSFLNLRQGHVYTYEIDRQNRERIGGVSDRETGRKCRFITLCPLYVYLFIPSYLRGFTEECYSLPFSTSPHGLD